MSLTAALVYLMLLLGIGIFSIKKNKNARDFFLAGSRLGLVPVVFATMASIMSGFVFVGGPGLFFEVGMGSFWITISSSFTGAMMGWLLAKPLLSFVRDKGCLTIPDLILIRFGCRFSSGMAAGAVLLGVMGYLAVQLQALGVILGSILKIEVEFAMIIGVAVIAFYSVGGGMVASVYTDVLQGSIMLVSTVLVFGYILDSGGGLLSISKRVVEQEASVLEPWGTVGVVGALGWFFVFSIGSLGQPHVINKFMMVRDTRVLRYFPLLLAVSMILCGLIWFGVGLYTRQLVLTGDLAMLSSPDAAVTTFLNELAPRWLSSLVYVGIISAIMSTADSFLNVGAAAASRDLPRALGIEVKREFLFGRIWSFGLLLLAVVFSLQLETLVAYLGIISFSTFAAALTPAIVLGLCLRRVSRYAARTSLVVGISVSVLLEVLRFSGYYQLETNSGLIAITLSFLVFLAVNELTSLQTGSAKE